MAKKKIENKQRIVVTPCERPRYWGNKVQSAKLDEEKAKNDAIIKKQQEKLIKGWRDETEMSTQEEVNEALFGFFGDDDG